MSIVNLETSKKLGNEISYLSYNDIKIEKNVEKIAELVRFRYKETQDTKKPYYQVVLKDINGRCVYGAWYDAQVNEDALKGFQKYTNVYVSAQFFATMYQGMKHLKITDMIFLDDEEITEDLKQAFTTVLEERDKYIEELVNDDYQEFKQVNNIFKQINLYNSIRQSTLKDIGSAKQGELAKIISFINSQVKYTGLNSALVKLVCIYGLSFYATTVEKKTFDGEVNIGKVLREFDSISKNILIRIKGTEVEHVMQLIVEESERLLCRLMNIPCTSSISVEFIYTALNQYKRLHELSTYYISAPKNSIINEFGSQILNM